MSLADVPYHGTVPGAAAFIDEYKHNQSPAVAFSKRAAGVWAREAHAFDRAAMNWRARPPVECQNRHATSARTS
jgi:hypothetical protein